MNSRDAFADALLRLMCESDPRVYCAELRREVIRQVSGDTRRIRELLDELREAAPEKFDEAVEQVINPAARRKAKKWWADVQLVAFFKLSGLTWDKWAETRSLDNPRMQELNREGKLQQIDKKHGTAVRKRLERAMQVYASDTGFHQEVDKLLSGLSSDNS